jgi:hypothetical protein
MGDHLQREAAQGDLLLSRFRRPMLKFTRDGAQGVHDMMIAACDQFRYEFFGHKGPHASCSENLCVAMRREGHQVDVIPQPINFFTNTTVEKDGSFKSPPNPVPPGAYVELEALMDLICVVSSCPFDLAIDGWTINAGQGPTELEVDKLWSFHQLDPASRRRCRARAWVRIGVKSGLSQALLASPPPSTCATTLRMTVGRASPLKSSRAVQR